MLKGFEDYTVGELREIVERPEVEKVVNDQKGLVSEIRHFSGTSNFSSIGVERQWFDEGLSPLYEDVDDQGPSAPLLELG